jgi:hypothetical protein
MSYNRIDRSSAVVENDEEEGQHSPQQNAIDDLEVESLSDASEMEIPIVNNDRAENVDYKEQQSQNDQKRFNEGVGACCCMIWSMAGCIILFMVLVSVYKWYVGEMKEMEQEDPKVTACFDLLTVIYGMQTNETNRHLIACKQLRSVFMCGG